MNKLFYATFLASVFYSTDLTAKEQQYTWGGGADMSKQVSVAQVLATPKKYLGKAITVKGEVVKVCEKRGCWMELATDKSAPSFIVKVRDGDMVFPMSSIGKQAYATGKLSENKLDLAQTRAYWQHRKEENKLDLDLNTITKPMTLYRLVPQAVTIEN